MHNRLSLKKEKGKMGGREGGRPLAGHTHHFSSWYNNFTIKIESSCDTCLKSHDILDTPISL